LVIVFNGIHALAGSGFASFQQWKRRSLTAAASRGKELCRAFDLHIAAIRLIYLTAPRPLGTPKGE